MGSQAKCNNKRRTIGKSADRPSFALSRLPFPALAEHDSFDNAADESPFHSFMTESVIIAIIVCDAHHIVFQQICAPFWPSQFFLTFAASSFADRNRTPAIGASACFFCFAKNIAIPCLHTDLFCVFPGPRVFSRRRWTGRAGNGIIRWSSV